MHSNSLSPRPKQTKCRCRMSEVADAYSPYRMLIPHTLSRTGTPSILDIPPEGAPATSRPYAQRASDRCRSIDPRCNRHDPLSRRGRSGRHNQETASCVPERTPHRYRRCRLPGRSFAGTPLQVCDRRSVESPRILFHRGHEDCPHIASGLRTLWPDRVTPTAVDGHKLQSWEDKSFEC